MKFFSSVGRKFIMAETTIIASFVFLFIGKLSESSFVTIAIATIAAYLSANVVQSKNKKPEEP